MTVSSELLSTRNLDSLPAVEEDLDKPSKHCHKEKSQEDDTTTMLAYSPDLLGKSTLHVLVRQPEIAKPVRHYDLCLGYSKEGTRRLGSKAVLIS